MNPSDDDLDCLLKEWTAPQSPDSLEGRLRRAYGNRARSGTTVLTGEIGQQRKWRADVWTRWGGHFLATAGKFAGVAAGAVVLLAVITRAFPQSLSLAVPTGAITLDSEFLEYKEHGAYAVREYRSSFVKPTTIEGDFIEGGETVLSSSFPGDPLRTATVELLNPVKVIVMPVMHRMLDPLFFKPHRAEYLGALEATLAARVRNGCVPTPHWGTPMRVIGKETLLNYATTVSRYEFKDERFTEWFAPGLDCFSLRSTIEKALPEGAFQLASERRVLKVTKNLSATPEREPTQ